jgi:hypothetical protein
MIVLTRAAQGIADFQNNSKSKESHKVNNNEADRKAFDKDN